LQEHSRQVLEHSMPSRRTETLFMNTASRSFGTRTSQRWLIRYGKPEAVRRDRRKRTGSMPPKNCGPAGCSREIRFIVRHEPPETPNCAALACAWPTRAFACLASGRDPGTQDGRCLLKRLRPWLRLYVPKGEALASERDRLHCTWVLLVGDDESDEDAFSPEGKTISVRVGRKRQSHANYSLRPHAKIDELLE